MISYLDLYYFNALGYKVIGNMYDDIIVKDFQRHTKILVDGIIGKQTRAKMREHNKNNFCPEVFEPIKPYVPYTDRQVEKLCFKGLVGLGEAFNYHSRVNGLDVLHNLAHAILESDWGTSPIALKTNNLYGWACYDSSPLASAKRYKDFTDCIETWSREYNKLYLEPDGKQFRGNSEYAVNMVYATSPIAGINKSFIVKDLREKINNE